MFEKFVFSERQIKKYYVAAKKDYQIAASSDVPEVVFRFCYDSLLKLSMAACAINGLRVKSRQGHHIELIRKLAILLNDDQVEAIGDSMRKKRNFDLYSGGVLISEKEANEYLKWTQNVFQKYTDYANRAQQRLI